MRRIDAQDLPRLVAEQEDVAAHASTAKSSFTLPTSAPVGSSTTS
jgi:hypothetical protein